MEINIYFDGACNPNPGRGGAGVFLYDPQTKSSIGFALGLHQKNSTCNVAEWSALNLGIQKAIESGYSKFNIYGDSRLVINCASQYWNTKQDHLKILLAKTINLLIPIQKSNITWTWIPRDKNVVADSLSNLAMTLLEDQLEIYPNYEFEVKSAVSRFPAPIPKKVKAPMAVKITPEEKQLAKICVDHILDDELFKSLDKTASKIYIETFLEELVKSTNDILPDYPINHDSVARSIKDRLRQHAINLRISAQAKLHP